jgi:glutathione S-transferase
MKLYSAPLSLFSRKVEIALAEKGLACERIMVGFSQEAGYEPKHPVVLAANPKREVPVLIDGDLTLFDSTLILEYLEDAHPVPALFPVGAQPRARCRLIELYADEIMMRNVRRLLYRTEPRDADERRQLAREAEGQRADAELRGQYDWLEQQLAGREYFCGTVSVADIAVFMMLVFALRLGGPQLAGHEALAHWYGRAGGRPAFARAAAEIAAADAELSPPVLAA